MQKLSYECCSVANTLNVCHGERSEGDCFAAWAARNRAYGCQKLAKSQGFRIACNNFCVPTRSFSFLALQGTLRIQLLKQVPHEDSGRQR